MEDEREPPTAETTDEVPEDAGQGAVQDAGSPPPPDGATGVDAPDQGEPVTRLVLVVLGIAVLGLATWWLSPPDEVVPEAPTDVSDVEDVEAPELMISLFGGMDDRFFAEPCTRIPGGGLFAVRAAVDLAREEAIRNHLGVSMGDLSLVPGLPGLSVQEQLLTEVLPLAGIDVVAAGVGELQHGVAFARGALAGVTPASILCANALDENGDAVLRGWAVTSSGGHNVLTVAVAGDSIGYELVARGSDVRIGPAADYAAQALATGTERAADVGSPAMTKLLLVQGTLDEAEAIAKATPGFDAVVASRGGVLPDLEPRRIGTVPIYYAGRGARFVWQIATGGSLDGLQHRLTRIGDRAGARGSPYENQLYGIGGRLMAVGYPNLRKNDERTPDPRGDYVGSVACADCHPDEVVQHAASAHANLPKSALEGPYAGSPACLSCHATGPFRRTGWMPGDDDAGLTGVSCEACHGPASSHVADPGPGYGAVDLASCYTCHLPDKSPGLDAEVSWAASGHGALPPPPKDEDHDQGGEDGDGDDPDTDGE